MNKSFLVKYMHLANNVMSGDLPVLSTPSLLGFMENTCLEFMRDSLNNNKTSVGVKVDLKHLNPNIEGAIIDCKILNIDKKENKWIFEVEAVSNNIIVGKCVHTRYIVDRNTFL